MSFPDFWKTRHVDSLRLWSDELLSLSAELSRAHQELSRVLEGITTQYHIIASVLRDVHRDLEKKKTAALSGIRRWMAVTEEEPSSAAVGGRRRSSVSVPEVMQSGQGAVVGGAEDSSSATSAGEAFKVRE